MQIEDGVLHNLASFAQMTDELTDISVLKQLVLVARYILPAGDVTTSFLTIVRFHDMAMKNWRCCMTCMEKETILMSTQMPGGMGELKVFNVQHQLSELHESSAETISYLYPQLRKLAACSSSYYSTAGIFDNESNQDRSP